jgi:hypothetical protein
MVFMHAPKCAGIALSRWLAEHYGFMDYSNPELKLPKGIVERHRYTLPENCQNYEIITCIREPFERWESFYLYCCLQMGVNETFGEFTRTRLKYLPLQSLYTKEATYILRVDSLDTEVLTLPFVKPPVPEIHRLNVSKSMPDYQQMKQRIQWTDELRQLIRQHFSADFTTKPKKSI